jgi:hypothetical protein
MEWFADYLKRFEAAIAEGVRNGSFGSFKMVPVLPGKLSTRRIGKTLGLVIDTDDLLVIDFYGYLKKSRGFADLAKEVAFSMSGKQVKMVEAPVVHFNSVRLEVIARIDGDLVPDFGRFKKAVLDAREFQHNYSA